MSDAKEALKQPEVVALDLRDADRDGAEDTVRTFVVVLVPVEAAVTDTEKVSVLRTVTERVSMSTIVVAGVLDTEPEGDLRAVALGGAVDETDARIDLETDGEPDEDALTETVTEGLVDSDIDIVSVKEPVAVTDGDGDVDGEARADAESDGDTGDAEAFDDAVMLLVIKGVREVVAENREEDDRLNDGLFGDAECDDDFMGDDVLVIVLVLIAETLRVIEIAVDADILAVTVVEAKPETVAIDAVGVVDEFADELPREDVEGEALARWLKLTVSNAEFEMDSETEPELVGCGEKLDEKDVNADTFTDAVAEPPLNPPMPFTFADGVAIDAFGDFERTLDEDAVLVAVLDAVAVFGNRSESVADDVADEDAELVADDVGVLVAVLDAVAVFGNRSESVADDVADEDAELVVEDVAEVDDVVDEDTDFVVEDVAEVDDVVDEDTDFVADDVTEADADEVHDTSTQIPVSHTFDVQSELIAQLAPRCTAKRRGISTSSSLRCL